MEQTVIRKFTALDADVICECKNVKEPIESSMYFHNHDGHEILLVLNGVLDFYTESGKIRLERRDLVCVDEYYFHGADLITKEKYDRIVINVRGDYLGKISSEQTNLAFCFSPYDSRRVKVIHLSEDEMEEYRRYAVSLQKSLTGKMVGDELCADAFLKLIMVMIMHHFLDCEIPQPTELMPQVVVETFSYIENHLAEEITLKKLEGHIHHNGTYLSRCFKRTVGISLQQFIIAKKITLSCKLLREGYSPCDACFMTGFNNYSNYSRTFSKQVGMSPKKYQMKNR